LDLFRLSKFLKHFQKCFAHRLNVNTVTVSTYLNEEIMRQYRPELKKFYYDPAKYNTYLEQLGIDYPQLEKK